MPLKFGYSKGSISENIRRERRAGKNRKQAVRIAYEVARDAAKKAGKPWKAPKIKKK